MLKKYTSLILEKVFYEFWFLSIRFGPKHLLKM